MFIKQVEEQLSRMSVAEKEEWILSQARFIVVRSEGVVRILFELMQL